MLSKTLLTLGAALFGGSALFMLNVPLAWMLGAFSVCTLLALSGKRPFIPLPLRRLALTVIGLFIGLRFDADIWGNVAQWGSSLILLVLCTVVTTAIVYWILTRKNSEKWSTYLFCACPGGLAEMVNLSQEARGDDKAVALMHLARIVLTVSSLPLLLPLWGVTLTNINPWSVEEGAVLIPGLEVFVLVFGALGLAWCFNRIRVPAFNLTAGLCMGALFSQFSGVTPDMPDWVSPLAQLVIGAHIGCRFNQYRFRDIGKTFFIGTLVGALMLAISVVFAFGASYYLDVDMMTLLLSYAPGGLSEIGIIALTLGVDATFVSLHHLVRIVFVIFAMTVTMALIERRIKRA